MDFAPQSQPRLTTPLAGLEPAVGPGLMGYLVQRGMISGDAAIGVLRRAREQGRPLAELLLEGGLVSPETLLSHRAGVAQLPYADPASIRPDPHLLDRWGAQACLRDGLLPLVRQGGRTVVLVPDLRHFDRHHTGLAQRFGPVVPRLATPRAIEAAVLAQRGPALARLAEQRSPARLSARSLGTGRIAGVVGAGLLALAAGLWFAPGPVMLGVLLWYLLWVCAGAGLRLAALRTPLRPEAHLPDPDHWPHQSLILCLRDEADIVPRLIARLARLSYPDTRLDVLLVIEEDDAPTAAALDRVMLPPWARTVRVPKGTIHTKPRALNHALALCRGEIVGILDAEDAPDPDVLRLVARTFAARPARVACLQGALDFYNGPRNLLSRAFTLEYGAWFRALLPGLDRMGLPVPLGGTTVFLRRAALDALGGWDAHNVTEDADLGLRIARAGLRTEIIPTATMEEATCAPWAWVRQRSRWIKGFAITWAVHMRAPRQLWRDLGPRGFAAVQVLLLGSLSQQALAPVLWSLWLPMVGVDHALAALLPLWAKVGLAILTGGAELISLAACLRGLRLSGQPVPRWAALLMPAYYPLASFAALKAVAELILCPFRWDKTRHGRYGG